MIPEELIERFVEMGYEPRRQYRTVLDARRRAPAQIQLILSAVHDGELGLFGEGKMETDKKSERRMHLATRLENMGYQLHGPHKGWLITRISSVDSSPTLDHVETLVERLEEKRK